MLFTTSAHADVVNPHDNPHCYLRIVSYPPPPYLAPSLPMLPLEETRVMGLLGGESCIILTSTEMSYKKRYHRLIY